MAAAGERQGGGNRHGFEDLRTKNGSSQGQNLALTGLFFSRSRYSNKWNRHVEEGFFVMTQLRLEAGPSYPRRARPEAGPSERLTKRAAMNSQEEEFASHSVKSLRSSYTGLHPQNTHA